MMKRKVRGITALAAAMILCLGFETQGMETVKAGTVSPLSVNEWYCVNCGSTVVVSVEKRVRILSEEKCKQINHDPDCHICEVEDLDVYFITCPTCNITSEQNTTVTGRRKNVHLCW